MPKDRLQELNLLISQASSQLTKTLGKVDQVVIDSIPDLSTKEKIDFYKWLSEHQQDRMTEVPKMLPGAKDGR